MRRHSRSPRSATTAAHGLREHANSSRPQYEQVNPSVSSSILGPAPLDARVSGLVATRRGAPGSPAVARCVAHRRVAAEHRYRRPRPCCEIPPGRCSQYLCESRYRRCPPAPGSCLATVASEGSRDGRCQQVLWTPEGRTGKPNCGNSTKPACGNAPQANSESVPAAAASRIGESPRIWLRRPNRRRQLQGLRGTSRFLYATAFILRPSRQRVCYLSARRRYWAASCCWASINCGEIVVNA